MSELLPKPADEKDLERLCLALYPAVYGRTVGCLYGRRGQKQHGIDVKPTPDNDEVLVQCKHYCAPLTKEDIRAIVLEFEAGNWTSCTTFIIATTAPNDTHATDEVAALNKLGKPFQIELHHWEEISGLCYQHPDRVRNFFPTSSFGAQHETLERIKDVQQQLSAQDPLLSILEHTRASIRSGRATGAEGLLETVRWLGSPQVRSEAIRQLGCIHSRRGEEEKAIEAYLQAFELARDSPKVWSNAAWAYCVRGDYGRANALLKEGLQKFPDDDGLWGLTLQLHAVDTGAIDVGIVPAHLQQGEQVQSGLAYQLYRQKEYFAAVEVLAKLVERTDQFDYAEQYLASVLAWLSEDHWVACHGQAGTLELEHLERALALAETQSEQHSAKDHGVEGWRFFHNLGIANLFLRRLESAESCAHQAMDCQTNPVTVRILALVLERRGDIEALSRLLDQQGELLFTECPGSLVDWRLTTEEGAKALEVLDRVDAQNVDDADAAHWAILRLLAVHQCEGMEAAQSYLHELPLDLQEYDGMRLAMASLHLQHRESGPALALLNAVVDGWKGRFADVFHESPAWLDGAANMLYSLEQYHRAAALLSVMVVSPGNDRLTYRRFVALLESDQRREARELWDALPAAAKQDKHFQLVYHNLLQRSGDAKAAKRLMEKLVKLYPDDLQLGLALCQCYLVLEQFQLIQRFLRDATNRYWDAPLDQVMELAKCEQRFGSSERALQRAYRSLRRERFSPEACGNYFVVHHLCRGHLQPHGLAEVKPPCAVVLSRDGQEKTYYLETADMAGLPADNQVCSPAHPIHQQVLGRRLRDCIEWVDAFDVPIRAELVRIDPLFDAVLRRVAGGIPEGDAATGSPVIVMRMSTGTDGGEPEFDFEPLLQSIRARERRVKETIATYHAQPVPLSVLARMLGVSPIPFWQEFRRGSSGPVHVSSGDPEQSFQCVQRAEAIRGHRVVVDLVTLMELLELDMLGLFQSWFGTPVVPASLRMRVQRDLDVCQVDRSTGRLVSQEGQVMHLEYSAEGHDQERQFLERLLSVVDSECQVLPATGLGPLARTEAYQQVTSLLDEITTDCLLLAEELHEDGGGFCSEDLRVRDLARYVGLNCSFGLHALWLARLNDRSVDADTKQAFRHFLQEKVALNHSFLCMTFRDVHLLLGQDNVDRNWATLRHYLTVTKVNPESMVRLLIAAVEAMVEARCPVADIKSWLSRLLGFACSLQPEAAGSFARLAREGILGAMVGYTWQERSGVSSLITGWGNAVPYAVPGLYLYCPDWKSAC